MLLVLIGNSWPKMIQPMVGGAFRPLALLALLLVKLIRPRTVHLGDAMIGDDVLVSK